MLTMAAMFAGPLLRFTGATGGGAAISWLAAAVPNLRRCALPQASLARPSTHACGAARPMNGLEGVEVLHNEATLIPVG